MKRKTVFTGALLGALLLAVPLQSNAFFFSFGSGFGFGGWGYPYYGGYYPGYWGYPYYAGYYPGHWGYAGYPYYAGYPVYGYPVARDLSGVSLPELAEK
jgi:hypothetical protein